MAEIKLIEALIISMLLAGLIFRTNYTSNIKISRARYQEKNNSFNYLFFWVDVGTAILFALIGCYLSWDMITTIPDLYEYLSYRTPISIGVGVMFQQALPILIEYSMNKLNAFKSVR